MNIEVVRELKQRGNDAFRIGDWKNALQYFTKALEGSKEVEVDNVTLSTLSSNRSATYAFLEDYAAALQDAERAIEARKDWSRGYARKAAALVGLDRCQEAILVVDEGLELDPTDDVLLKMQKVITEEIPADLKLKAAEASPLEEAIAQIEAAGVTESLPIMVISGFLGSGKTTLLSRILTKNEAKKRIAVLVNDMAEINIDAEMLKHTHDVSQTTEEFTELTNGCVCCTLRGDLIKEAVRIACSGKFDLMVIEATGISEPMPVAATFVAEDVTGASLKKYFQIDNMITLVDCSRFLKELEQAERLNKRNLGNDEEDERNIAQLLTDQVEFANTILLNKCDLATSEQIQQIQGLVKQMNPKAEVLTCTKSEVDLNQILHTQRFKTEWAESMDGLKTELVDPHVSETLEYGISSVVFKSRIPFHPERLHAFFFGSETNEEHDEMNILEESLFNGVYRSKGVFYVASNMDAMISWSTAGTYVEFGVLGRWLVSMIPENLWPTDKPDWDKTWGDRQHRVVLIGKAPQLQDILLRLEKCLLTDEEQSLGEDKWKTMDPEDLWQLAEDSEEGAEEDSEEDSEENSEDE